MFKKCGKITKKEKGSYFLENKKGDSYAINHTMVYIWNLMNGTRSPDEVAGKIATMAKIDQDQALRIVQKILDELRRVELLQDKAS